MSAEDASLALSIFTMVARQLRTKPADRTLYAEDDYLDRSAEGDQSNDVTNVELARSFKV